MWSLLDEHDSPQWYNIIYFEHKLSWLFCELPQKASCQWKEWDFHPTPLLEQSTPPVNRGSSSFSFGVFVIFYYAFEDPRLLFLLEFFVRHLKILLTWLSLGHNSDTMLDEHDSSQWYDIVHFEHKISWLYFELPQKTSCQWSFPKRPHVNGESIPLITMASPKYLHLSLTTVDIISLNILNIFFSFSSRFLKQSVYAQERFPHPYCNGSGQPLANVVLFGPVRASPQFLKRVC